MLLYAGVAVGGYLAGSVLVAVLVAIVNGVPWKQRVKTRPQDLSPRARVVDFEALDGVRLRAFFAPPEGDRPVVVFQAGKRATRDHMLPWARVLAEAGYGVFTFDWRAQGESQGNLVSYGAHARLDVGGVLRVLDTLPEAAGRPVGIYACSLGAACMALASQDLPERVHCMVLDSPYGDLGRMATQRLSFLGPLAVVPRAVLDGIARALLGTTPAGIVPEASLEAFAPRPVLVMHGDADTVIPVEEGRSLATRYPGPTEYWEIPGLDHVDARIFKTREFMERIAAFFERHLPGAAEAAAVLAMTPERLVEP